MFAAATTALLFACGLDVLGSNPSEPPGGVVLPDGAPVAPPGSTDGSVAAEADAPAVVNPIRCDRALKWGEPEQVPLPLPTGNEGVLHARLTADEQTLFFATEASNDVRKLFVATRPASGTGTWPATEVLSGDTTFIKDWPMVDSAGTLFYRRMTEDDRSYIVKSTKGAGGIYDNAQTLRATDGLGTNYYLTSPYVSASGDLYFAAERVSGTTDRDIFRATLQNGEFKDPIVISALGTTDDELSPALTSDELDLYYSRAPVGEEHDIYLSHRDSTDKAFPAGTRVDELTTTQSEYVTWISPDNCRMYLTRNTDNGFRVFLRKRP